MKILHYLTERSSVGCITVDLYLPQTYFNPYCLAVLRALIFGGVTPEFEQILAEGAGLIGGPNLSSDHPHGDRCRVTQLSIQDSRFVDHVVSVVNLARSPLRWEFDLLIELNLILWNSILFNFDLL